MIIEPALSLEALRPGLEHAVPIVDGVCRLAGSYDLLDRVHDELQSAGVLAAVQHHDTPVIFDWLMSVMSFQGIADSVAEAHLDRYGNVTWADIDASLARMPRCPKLTGYWRFDDCRYVKTTATCSMTRHLPACPLPTLSLS